MLGVILEVVFHGFLSGLVFDGVGIVDLYNVPTDGERAVSGCICVQWLVRDGESIRDASPLKGLTEVNMVSVQCADELGDMIVS